MKNLMIISIVVSFGVSCSKSNDVAKVVEFSNQESSLSVSLSEEVNFTIDEPSENGKKISWIGFLKGSCLVNDRIIKVSGDVNQSTSCVNNQWELEFDSSKLPIGNVTVKVGMVNLTGLMSETQEIIFNKVNNKCDLDSVRDANFAGGDGSLANPYLICTTSQFSKIRNFKTSNYHLMSDLNFKNNDMDPITADFTGIFEGNDFVIRNYHFENPQLDLIGLFRRLKFPGEIKNLHLQTISINGKNNVGLLAGSISGKVINVKVDGLVEGGSNVGGLVGSVSASGSITNSSSSGLVKSHRSNVGGLVGYSLGSIHGSHSSVKVTLVSDDSTTVDLGYAGGLVGRASQIENSYALGSVTVSNSGANFKYAGGLAGYTSNIVSNTYALGDVTVSNVISSSGIGGLIGGAMMTVRNSYASGNVIATDNYAGGLIGRSSSGVENSYAKGNVTGRTYVGGLLGSLEKSSAITNSYAHGAVNANDDFAGGLVGSIASTTSLYKVYALGNVTAEGSYGGGLVGRSSVFSKISSAFATGNVSVKGSYAGGLIGHQTGHVSQCFAIGNISTNNFGGGLVGYLHKYSSLQQCYSLGDFERLGSATYFGGLIGAKFLNSPQPIIQDVYRNSDALTDGGYVPNASGTALSAYHMEDELNFEGFAFDANPGNFSMKEDSFKPAWFNETHFPYPMLNFY